MEMINPDSRPRYLFEDRKQAGRALAEELRSRRIDKGSMILALSPGGVVVGGEVALALNLQMDFFILNKLTVPGRPERTFGAISESGKIFLHSEVVTRYEIPDLYIQQAILSRKDDIIHRQQRYLKGRKRPNFQKKEVIVIDEGVQTGATLFAALQTFRSRGVKRIITAVPVAPGDLAGQIENRSDETVLLHSVPFFSSVADYYLRFTPVSDEEVVAVLKQVNEKREAA